MQAELNMLYMCWIWMNMPELFLDIEFIFIYFYYQMQADKSRSWILMDCLIVWAQSVQVGKQSCKYLTRPTQSRLNSNLGLNMSFDRVVLHPLAACVVSKYILCTLTLICAENKWYINIVGAAGTFSSFFFFLLL